MYEEMISSPDAGSLNETYKTVWYYEKEWLSD